MDRSPCPCCGHRTLPSGPGCYELCPVCFWEDDGGQLRFPMSPEGANGISLVEAQQLYARYGAMDKTVQRKVRSARIDEPIDEGWRPFDPARDWTNPELDGDQWPVNSEALYYWRPTYWNGDQHKMPRGTREPTPQDRFLDHLRGVPELGPAVAASERRWGEARAFDVCDAAAGVVLAAYRRGNEDVGLRVVAALLPALDEDSPMYAPNCVVIAFLEREGWHEPWIQEFVDRWPSAIRAELHRQQAPRNQHMADMAQRSAGWEELVRSGRGQPVAVLADRLRVLGLLESDDPRTELWRELTARVISNRWWLFRHPVESLGLAWRHRDLQAPLRTLAWLRRPRIAG